MQPDSELRRRPFAGSGVRRARRDRTVRGLGHLRPRRARGAGAGAPPRCGSPTASSSRWSARPAAASRPSCGWSAGWCSRSTGVVIVGGREVAAQGAARRHGVPESDHAALADDRAEHHAAAQDRRAVPLAIPQAKRKTEFRDKANALLEQVGLKGFGSRYPVAALRRHASARQSVPRADPRAAHAAARRALRRARPVHARRTVVDPAGRSGSPHRPTVLLVTHDLREAGFLASRICVMSARPGRILDDSRVDLRAPAHASR